VGRQVPELEEVLQRLSEELDDHEDAVVVRIAAEVVETRDAGCLSRGVLMPWKI